MARKLLKAVALLGGLLLAAKSLKGRSSADESEHTVDRID